MDIPNASISRSIRRCSGFSIEKLVAANLARRGSRERTRYETELPRHLVTRKRCTTVLVERFSINGSRGPYERDDTLAPRDVLGSHNGRFDHGIMGGEHCFHFGRIDVLATSDNEIFAPVEDAKKSLTIDFSDVSRSQPAVPDRAR